MGFLALVITLVLEQLRPVPARGLLSAMVESAADNAERNLNAGQARHGAYAWVVLVIGATVLAGAVYFIAAKLSWIAALAVNIAVLYATLGFRQFSHPFTEIQLALNQGDLDAARRELTAWKRLEDPSFDATTLPVEEVVRQAMERGVVLSHRHVFGVFFWFVLLPGPMGPVLYRLADYVARRWNRPATGAAPTDRFGEFALRAFAWIDWVPSRLTALGFAIVGDFEGAIYCWRQVARTSPQPAGLPAPPNRALLLAAASGAMSTRVMPATEAAHHFDEAGHEGAGLAEPEPRSLTSGVGLVWRALILWLILLLLLSLAGWFG